MHSDQLYGCMELRYGTTALPGVRKDYFDDLVDLDEKKPMLYEQIEEAQGRRQHAGCDDTDRP